MGAPMGTSVATVHMSTHDMGTGAMTGQMPASHGHFDTGCRILCYGWVETAQLVRPDGRSSEIVMTLAPALFDLRDGITPQPIGPLPKPTSFACDIAAIAACPHFRPFGSNGA